jgi:hypothetical protein
LQGFSFEWPTWSAARLLPEIVLCVPSKTTEDFICSANRETGATGLEPATSGVTGPFTPSQPSTRSHTETRFPGRNAAQAFASSRCVTAGPASCGRKTDARQGVWPSPSCGPLTNRPQRVLYLIDRPSRLLHISSRSPGRAPTSRRSYGHTFKRARSRKSRVPQRGKPRSRTRVPDPVTRAGAARG